MYVFYEKCFVRNDEINKLQLTNNYKIRHFNSYANHDVFSANFVYQLLD